MPKSELQKFADDFWINYNKKNYNGILTKIPNFLKFDCESNNLPLYQQLCIFTIISINIKDKSEHGKYARDICIKYLHMLKMVPTGINALNYFNCMEYVMQLKNFSEAVDSTMLKNMLTAVLDKVQRITEWTEVELMSYKKFIIILVQMESLLDKSPKFPMAAKAVEYFSTNISKQDEMKNGWPEYVLNMLQILMLPIDERPGKVASLELLKKFRSLVENKDDYRKDIAIMTSQVIRACTSLISKSSETFIEDIFHILGNAYDIVRDKTLTTNYSFTFTYNRCCENMNTHAGLQILEAIRKIFVGALEINNFNEKLCSSLSFFVVAESTILESFDCEHRSSLVWELGETMKTISRTTMIDKIVTKCGHDRSKKTLERFLSTTPQSPRTYSIIADALIEICEKAGDKHLKILSFAKKCLNGSTSQKRHYIWKLHECQVELDDPTKFEPISSILNKFTVKEQLVHLQLLELVTEIEYPKLTVACKRKLIEDVCKMDFYHEDGCGLTNLIKSTICYVDAMANIQHYRSNFTSTDYYEPLKEDFASINNEIVIITKLVEASDYLAKFLQDTDVWFVEKDKIVWRMSKNDFISFMENLLKKIGESLMNRHYKELAIPTFNLLYKLAEMVNHPLKQIVAAGHIIENIGLHLSISEKEIVTKLQGIIMEKLKDVNTMSVDELGDYLRSFLQLTMYTVRYQYNIDHAKKYMQAINKLLNKFDSEQEKFIAVRLKYNEVMFELIVKESKASIAPFTFVEDIFHRFKRVRYVSSSDHNTVPGIMFDLVSTLYAFTRPRYEFLHAKSLFWTVHTTSIRNGYLFLFAKSTILTISECLLVNGKRLENHLNHLDTVFECKASSAVQKESDVPAITWNKEITSLIHPDNCNCFQCTNKFLSRLIMEVAAVKAWAVYYSKDYQKSLQSFQKIYDNWKATNATSYSAMLMNYSNCLISNRRENKSKEILSEALDSCNDYAQAQDISVRLLIDTLKELKVDDTPSYASEISLKATKKVAKTIKKKLNGKPSEPSQVLSDRKIEWKDRHLLNDKKPNLRY